MAKISSAESQVMEALWSRGPLTPEEIVAEVGPANGWARNTVRVIMTRTVFLAHPLAGPTSATISSGVSAPRLHSASMIWLSADDIFVMLSS